MDKISKAIDQTEDEISKLANRNLKELVKKWSNIFTPDLVESNIHLLKDHVQTFFNEILSETDKKEETILKRIDGLRKEQAQLQRLLQVERRIELPKLPLLSFQLELDKSLEDLREELQSRKLQIKELLLQQESLCNILDEPKWKLYEDPLSSADDIDLFKQNLTYLHDLKIEREKTLMKLRSEIAQLSHELDLPIIEDPCHSLLNNSDVTLSNYNIGLLSQLERDLTQQKIEISTAVINLKKKLEILWDCLEVDKSVRKKFNAYTGCSQATYDRLKQELNRCEGEKRRHIKVFVDRIRQEILKVWDQLLMSDEERELFGAFTSECYNEDLLQLHELELESLKDTFEQNKKILESFAKHKKLFERMIALETTNPDRLQNRGGQLLREEQERKKINRELPAIKQEILDLAAAYEQRKNRPFLVCGRNIVDATNGLYEEREERKQMLASNRKLNATVQRTPMSVKGSNRKMNGTTAQRTPISVNKSQLKRTGSVTITTNDAKKYRSHLEVPGSSRAQRGLFNDQNTKTAFAQPASVVKKKKTTIIKAVVSSLVNRRQSMRNKKRKSKNSSKGSSLNQSKKKNPSAESSVLDYGDFQHVVSARKASRSSEIDDYRSPLRQRNDNKSAKLLRPPTPSQSQHVSPRARGSKLSTRNVPIMF
ncbi:hypothetical protein HA402_002358 [Bradysia odoriphaga]|nr:hypothetical protein HA402_002358 [Bradysia odoriphaga]